MVKDGSVKVRERNAVVPRSPPDPGWEGQSKRTGITLKILRGNAIRAIKQHINDRPTVNVSFSGGKDSTVVLHIAKKAGVTKAFFIRYRYRISTNSGVREIPGS